MTNENENRSEFQQILKKLEQIEALIREKSEKTDGGIPEKLLDNSDMCMLLGITKRTLQRYREKDVVPYYMMRGKPYYKPAEVQECLKRIIKENNRRKPKK